MGQVWKAVDTRLARPVALKILPRGLLQDYETRARFLREAQASSMLNHPNIVTVFDTGEYGEELFIAMEILEGETVREIIKKGACRHQMALDIVKQALTGLSAAHDAGIIHRDLKPENIMVLRDGCVKILDFGLAKIREETGERQLTLTQGIIGTPAYMSTEQASGDPVDMRSDLFSMGTILHELLSGKPPFTGDNCMQVLTSILSREAPAVPGASPALQAVLAKALKKNREERYRSAGEFLSELTAVMDGAASAPCISRREASLVVLPFSAPSEDEDFADGIVDEIISSLSRVKNVRVIARTTTHNLKHQKMDIGEIGRTLGVDVALEGNLRRAGDRIRVSTNLVDTRSGFQVWSERFQMMTKDVFDMQDEISSGVISALRKHLASEEPSEPDARLSIDTPVNQPPGQSVDSSVSELYFRGLALLSTLRVDDLQSSVELLTTVTERMPSFATAHATLSYACLMLKEITGPSAPPELAVKGRAAAIRALELDPQNPDARVSLATIEFFQNWNLRKGISLLEEALKTAPGNVEALSLYSYALAAAGDPVRGADCARKAIERDPVSSKHYVFLAYALVSQGLFSEAINALDRALRLSMQNPFAYMLLLWCNLATGRADEAQIMKDFLVNLEYDCPLFTAILGLHRQITEAPESFPVTEDGREAIKDDPEAEFFLADIYAVRGDAESAVDALESSVDKGELNLPFIDNDPFLSGIRNNRRFIGLRERIMMKQQTIHDSK